MIPQDSTHTLNLLKTICQKAMNDLQSKNKKVGVILPKIKQRKVLNQHQPQMDMNQKQENLQFKLKLGQFKLVNQKIMPKKLSQIKLDNNQSNSSQFEGNESLKVISYISNGNEIERMFEINSSSRIKNRKFKFNSLQF